MAEVRNSGVYLIVSPSKGRYVGSSRSLNKRLSRYRNYSCSRQSAILSSLKKYGFENHILKILYYCAPDELLFWERVFGDIYLASAEFPNGLNITLPGYGDVPQIRSKEFRERVSKIQKQRFLSEEERRKVGDKSKEALNRPEIREKLSHIHKKRFENKELRDERSAVRKAFYQNNPEAKVTASEKQKEVFENNPDIKEKCVSALIKYRKENPEAHGVLMRKLYNENPELGEKHSAYLKQYYINHPEARIAASERSKKQFANPENNIRCKRVINTETGEVFLSAKIAALKYGYCYTSILNWLTGKTKNKTPLKYM